MEKQAEDHKYNGWGNYETWTVSLWLDNDQHNYRYWRAEAQRHLKEAPGDQRVRNGHWTPEETARFTLAGQLKREVTDGVPLRQAGMYTDLLHGALSDVDWFEIVDSWMNE